MKRIIAATGMALVILAMPISVFAIAGGPTLTAQMVNSSVAVGGQFTVTAIIDAKTYQVSAATLQLIWPSDRLQLVSLQKGSFFTQDLGSTSQSAGTATLSAGTNPAKTGVGQAFVAVFQAIAAGQATVGFGSGTVIAATGQTGNVLDVTFPATVTISGFSAPVPTPPTPVPPLTPRPTSTPVPLSVGQVSTGPVETGLLALIVATVVVLLYVGYVSTDTFRRSEAREIAKKEQESTFDFRS